ncbi:MAG TPA: CarD family transcriptional regulator [Deltaproteobacteria bacterium]|nr:CarD family transcriptional regulator [Deltaproteobacteria bacterium]
MTTQRYVSASSNKSSKVPSLPFKVGDMAVYPAHGVGEVTGIESREISGSKQIFYVLQILDSGMKIMVPTTNVNAVGLREIISESEVKAVYAILKERDVAIDNQTWNRRYREYMDKIKTGSVYEIAEVYRDLSLLKSEKELSFGERKMLDTAKNLLVKELAFAEDCDEDEIEEKLEDIFADE